VPNPTGIVGCTSYLDAKSCQACSAPYYLNETTCFKSDIVIANCELYLDNYLCLKCTSGFYLASSVSCKKINVANCLTLVTESVCQTCQDGYVLVVNQGYTICQTMTMANCLVVYGTNKPSCKKCTAGYVIGLSGNCLVILVQIAGCVVYDSPKTCSKCTAPTVLSPDGKRCIQGVYDSQIDPNCDDTLLLTSAVCSICPHGYVFSGYACVPCTKNSFSSGCLSCDPSNQTVCFVCLPGFYQNKNGTCVPRTQEALPVVSPFIATQSLVLLWAGYSLFFWFTGF
jgi:hypothetical protein